MVFELGDNVGGTLLLMDEGMDEQVDCPNGRSWFAGGGLLLATKMLAPWSWRRHASLAPPLLTGIRRFFFFFLETLGPQSLVHWRLGFQSEASGRRV